VALPFTLKSILRQNKKNNYGNSNISPCKNIIFKKKSSKRNQNPSRHHNSITNLKSQTQAKISSCKNPHIKKNRPIIYYLGAYKNPLSYYTLNTISLPRQEPRAVIWGTPCPKGLLTPCKKPQVPT
jgi:hypothetical protein